MPEPKPIAGARALLFDRLVDLHAEGERDEDFYRVLTCEQLKASVRRELERLLNTRCSLPLHRLAGEERSVINYGIPDFSSLSAHNADDHRLIASVISNSIAAFEPRLRNINVTAEPSRDGYWMMNIRIEADLIIESVTEPVHFSAVLNNNGAAEVNDSEQPGRPASLLQN